jgi:ABC-type glycerol-3-phosphate transport system substrate-binding protein
MMIVTLAACGSSNNTPATTQGTTAATTAAATTTEAAKPVELEVVASQPEYASQEQEIWKMYTEANPHVTIKMTTVNEDTAAAFNTRIAAGDCPDIQSYVGVSKDSYQTYQNLATINYPYWDLIQFDAKNLYSESNGTEAGYVPVMHPYSGVTFSFVYYEDLMDKTGLKPRDTIRTMADLDKFLADLKAASKANNIKYPLEMGWHSWCVFSQEIDELAVAMGANQTLLKDLWINQKISWTDIANNPYVPAFQKLKEWYEKGYLPQKWWTRNWESDFEAGFIAKNSILAFHGPWIWSKVETADPSAKLAGFPLPANKDGIIQNGNVDPNKGSVLFTANAKGEKQAEAVKAFIWWESPETVKMRAEAFGEVPLMDLSSVGLPDLASSQYNSVIKPIQEGFFGKVNFDSGLWATTLVGKYFIKGQQQVLASDDMAVNYGNYFEGKITIEQLMKICEDRYKVSYKFN